MALVVDLGITAGLHVRPIGTLEVRRMEDLDDRDDPTEEVHTYTAQIHPDGPTVTFEHRYGDGAWKCVQKALTALEET